MNMPFRDTRTWAIVTVMALASANSLRAQEKNGWTELFNGKDFAGWKFFLGSEGADNKGTYVIQDGVVICKGNPAGYIYTKKSYSDYLLQFDFAFKRPDGLRDDSKFRGNSGCLIHIGEKNALGVWPRSIEVQGAHRQLGLILPIPRNVKCRRTFDKAALAKVLKPVGEFNTVLVDVKGGDMVISVNGTKVSTVNDCELTKGPIGLQSEGAETHWKNVKIKER